MFMHRGYFYYRVFLKLKGCGALNAIMETQNNKNSTSLFVLTRLENTPELLLHSLKTAYVANVLLSKLNLDELKISVENVRDIILAASLHDIGKTTWAKDWNTKPRYLLKNQEWTVMQTHPLQSVNVLKEIFEYTLSENVYRYVAEHHERPGGKGYPYGIEPCLQARILAYCDIYAACSEHREYRGIALNRYKALECMAKVDVDNFAPIMEELIKEGRI